MDKELNLLEQFANEYADLLEKYIEKARAEGIDFESEDLIEAVRYTNQTFIDF